MPLSECVNGCGPSDASTPAPGVNALALDAACLRERESLGAWLCERGDTVRLGRFTCNGRGAHMFARPDHDARLADEALHTPRHRRSGPRGSGSPRGS